MKDDRRRNHHARLGVEKAIGKQSLWRKFRQRVGGIGQGSTKEFGAPVE